ncbi:MAG: integrase core domain-containing protein, partial [Alphaproteobacteria bacterium]|nr:integrase core domain-containing protein [Alphaproteobacteria bacterium]
DNVEQLKDQLQQYMLYYNELRPHQAINNLTPHNFAKKCMRNS